MEQFRTIQKGYEQIQRKLAGIRVTKSGQGAPDLDEENLSEYVHSEHLRFLDGTFGAFQMQSRTSADELDSSHCSLVN